MTTNVPGDFMRNNLPIGMGLRFEGLSAEVGNALSVWAGERQDSLGF